MNCFIINFNRLTSTKAMCEFLAATGVNPIIIDNDSSYPPLLEWYRSCPFEVMRMGANLGHLVVWKDLIWRPAFETMFKDRYYLVSDSDLDLSGVPHDYKEVLMRGLIENPNVTKSGLSLRIDDLPDNPYTKNVIEWESKFWTKTNGIFFVADLDTTIALYDKQRDFGKLPPEGNKFHWAVRSPKGYAARHIPWYVTKESLENDEEERYCLSHSDKYWATKFKELMP